MPTNRRKVMRHRRAPVSGCIETYLLSGTEPGPDEEGAFELFILRGNAQALRKVWEEVKERLLAEWIRERPGTRPLAWWMFDAPRDPSVMQGTAWEGTPPLPRRRIGGKGTPVFEVLNYVPHFHFGIPTHFVSRFDEEYYNGRARDIHGQKIGNHKEGDFSGVAIDPEDPPVYESQAEYLRQHGLFLPGEQRRLKPKDYEPERVTIEE